MSLETLSVKTEELCVKEEAEVSEAHIIKEEVQCEDSVGLCDLYADHQVKEELVLGPEELQRREPHKCTDRSSNSSYQCDECGKGFRNKTNLRQHTHSHLSKPLTYLEKSFNHAARKPLKCSLDSMKCSLAKVLRCLNCILTVRRLQRHTVTSLSLPMQSTLFGWLVQELPAGAVICHACYLILNASENDGNPSSSSRRLGHTRVCIGCGYSIFRSRNHILEQNDPLVDFYQWNITMPGHKNRVCQSCWQRGNRWLSRQGCSRNSFAS